MHGSHDHDHSGHGAPADNERRMGLAALITGAFMFAEVAGGIVAGSLALLADAGHMLTDFASLALAWFGFRLSRRPADWKRTYGFDRFQVLVAFANGLALFAIAGQNGLAGPYVALMQAISLEAERAYGKPGQLPVNATGAIGAIASELGLSWKLCRGLAVVSRAVGLLGHLAEEIEHPIANALWVRTEEEASSHLVPKESQ